MTILKVYDTIVEAKYDAVHYYTSCVMRGLDIKFLHAVHPYKMKIDDDCYVYAINNPTYLRGMRFNKIEDCTRSGVCDEIRACEYPLREG